MVAIAVKVVVPPLRLTLRASRRIVDRLESRADERVVHKGSSPLWRSNEGRRAKCGDKTSLTEEDRR